MAHLELPSNPKKRLAKAGLSSSPHDQGLLNCTQGTSVNGQSMAQAHGHMGLRSKRSELEEKAAERQKQRVEAAERQKKVDREVFMAEEMRLMGVKTVGEDDQDLGEPSQAFMELMNRKQPNKSMRLPARPLCMLQASDYAPPSGDYAELSRFLRLSTMPGHSSSDLISEYRGTHNMEVWNGQKGFDRQAFKMKRDWLSVWGEFNVKEQRWRKAWVEKFGAEKQQ